ncbi:LCP family protein [Streptomyces sp. ODS28]|uniref:LCP family protein n=1 Tax=Streptomyces sp. ODS28 TaxID=3136688 RepID=UPI0031EB399F
MSDQQLPPASSTTLYRSASRRRGDGRGRGGGGRTLRRALAAFLALVVLVAVGTYVWAEQRLRETPALSDYAGRPEPGEGTNWLVIGTDSRSDLSKEQRQQLHVGGADERNTDTMMVLHYGSSGPYLVSLPRDSYVSIPGHGKNKINSAYAQGGAKLLTRTVEQATGLRLDHYAEVDFLGFTGIVDALGGVRVCLDAALHDEKAGADLEKGCQTLDGKQALAFARARYSDPQGDLGRVKRQQKLLGAIASQATSPGTLLNPFRFYPFTGAALDATTVDDGSGVPSLTWMAWKVRGLTAGHGGTTTVPVANGGLSLPGIGDVVVWDDAGARELFDQLRRDVPITATRAS